MSGIDTVTRTLSAWGEWHSYGNKDTVCVECVCFDTVTRTLSACRAYHLCGLSSLARLSPPIKPSLSPREDYLNIQGIVVFYPVLYAHEAVFHTQSSRLQPFLSLFTPGDLLSCCQSASAGPRISSCHPSLLTCHAL